MEDILEELVGEIWDEHDEVVEDFQKIGDDTYIVDASVNYDDFCDYFNFESDEEIDSVSVGGWVMEQLGKIPEKDDSFEAAHLAVVVTGIDSHRVTQIKVTVSELEQDDGEDDD